MRGVGNTVGFAIRSWTTRANLSSDEKHVSICLPQASVPAADTAAGLPHADRLSSLLS